MFCFRYIIVNILDEGDNKDNDDDDDDDNNNNNNNNNNLTRIWQMNTVYVLILVLSTKGIIPSHRIKPQDSWKLFNLPPDLHITTQNAAILNKCRRVRTFLAE